MKLHSEYSPGHHQTYINGKESHTIENTTKQGRPKHAGAKKPTKAGKRIAKENIAKWKEAGMKGAPVPPPPPGGWKTKPKTERGPGGRNKRRQERKAQDKSRAG